MGLTDKHLAYGDDIPQTQAEKDYYWKIKHLEEQNNKLKEALCEKTGKWINEKWHGLDLIGVTCSNCHVVESRFSAYCPNCGAKMIKSEESEEET